VVLALTAGFVDAHLFLHVTPVFVANMSGNLIKLGVATGQVDWSGVLGSATALVAFVAGIAAATVRHDRRVRAGERLRPDHLLAAEAVLVLLIPVLVVGLHLSYSASSVGRDYPVLVVGAFAMGIQATVLRRVGSVTVTTTYTTGSLLQATQETVLTLRGRPRPPQAWHEKAMVVLGIIIASYVIGAAAASALGSSSALLLLPGGALLISALVWRQQIKGAVPAPPPESA
jgi:uncharacterized membrane protein YoaK (UPF0700 family)